MFDTGETCIAYIWPLAAWRGSHLLPQGQVPAWWLQYCHRQDQDGFQAWSSRSTGGGTRGGSYRCYVAGKLLRVWHFSPSNAVSFADSVLLICVLQFQVSLFARFSSRLPFSRWHTIHKRNTQTLFFLLWPRPRPSDLVFKLDMDIVKMYLRAKNERELNFVGHSKVRPLQTDLIDATENIAIPHLWVK